MAGFGGPVDRPASDTHIGVAVRAVEAKLFTGDDATASTAFDIACVIVFMKLPEGHVMPIVAEGELEAVWCEVDMKGASGNNGRSL